MRSNNWGTSCKCSGSVGCSARGCGGERNRRSTAVRGECNRLVPSEPDRLSIPHHAVEETRGIGQMFVRSPPETVLAPWKWVLEPVVHFCSLESGRAGFCAWGDSKGLWLVPRLADLGQAGFSPIHPSPEYGLCRRSARYSHRWRMKVPLVSLYAQSLGVRDSGQQ